MEKLDKKKVRAIGVSNFNINKLEKLAQTQTVVPAANQVRRKKSYKAKGWVFNSKLLLG